MNVLLCDDIMNMILSYQDGSITAFYKHFPDLACKCGHSNLLEYYRDKQVTDIPWIPTSASYSVAISSNCGLKFFQYLMETWSIEYMIIAGDAACEYGEQKILKYLFEDQKKVPVCSPKGIFHCVKNGHYEILSSYSKMFSPHYTSEILIVASEMGHLSTLELLLKEGTYVESDTFQCAFHLAIKNRHLTVAKKLLEANSIGILQGTRAIDTCASMGDLELLQTLYSLGGTESHAAVDLAAGNGHLEVVIYLTEVRKTILASQQAVTKAAKGGHLAVIEYLLEFRNEGCDEKCIDIAASAGHLPVVQYLVQQSQRFRNLVVTSDAIDKAAAGGYLDVVIWLTNSRRARATTEAMDLAAGNGHLDVVKWLHENRTEGCTTQAMDLAAQHGHIPVLDFLHTYRHEGCLRAVDLASQYGRIEVLQWFANHRQSCKRSQCKLQVTCSVFGMDWALGNGHINVANYLLRTFNASYSTAAIELSARSGHLKSLLWLHERAPELFKSDSILYKPQIIGYDCVAGEYSEPIDLAIRHGHCAVAHWLLYGAKMQPTPTGCDWAARNGHLATLMYVYAHTKIRPTKKALEWAIMNGHYDVTMYLLHQEVASPVTAKYYAQRYDQKSMLKWLQTNYQ